MARSDKSRSDKSRSDKSRSDKSRSDKSRSDKSRSDKSRSDKSRSEISRSEHSTLLAGGSPATRDSNSSAWSRVRVRGSAVLVSLVALGLGVPAAGAAPPSQPQVTTTITVGSQPFLPRLNGTGTTLYVANDGSNSVSVIDTSTLRSLPPSPLDKTPFHR
jgi:hypothetical protein